MLSRGGGGELSIGDDPDNLIGVGLETWSQGETREWDRQRRYLE